MNTLTATYRIVTPMFLGDADQHATDIRPPSIKGALRFWWRAMMWGQILTEAEGDEPLALRCLHRREAELFGSAADEKNGGGQGKFLLKVGAKNINSLSNEPIEKENPLTKEYPLSDGVGYLLGQGLYKPFQKAKRERFNDAGKIISPAKPEVSAHYLRSAISAKNDMSFEINLIFRQDNADLIQQMESTLILFGLLGGLGSRSRRGFGSVSISELKIGNNSKEIPKTIDELKKFLTQHITLSEVQPPFSAFSKLTRMDVSETNKDAWDLLKKVGEQMQEYRSYGYKLQDGKHYVRKNVEAEQNFGNDHKIANDHTLALKIVNGESVTQHPERVIFGLPHNYFFSSVKGRDDDKKVDVNVFNPNAKSNENNGRRASPLFIHIHRFSDGQCSAIQFFLDAIFLPSNYQIEMISKKLTQEIEKTENQENPVVPCRLTANPKTKVIEDYLDRFKNRQKIL